MALPDVINHQDALLTVNINEEKIIENVLPGLDIQPLFLDPERGVWVLYARFAPGLKLPTHFHSGCVHFYTTKGSWQYVEYPDQPQVAGSYLFEPGGSIHTFYVPENGEGSEGFMVVEGCNVNFDDDGNFVNIMDAGWIEKVVLEAAKRNGVTAPKYFKPKGGVGLASE